MGRLGLVGSHGIQALEPWGDAEPRRVITERGDVELLDGGDHLLLPRHGIDRYHPPHLIDHARNLSALLDAGCDRVLAICSVGGLREELAVGTFLCPDDFIALAIQDAAFDDRRDHVVPGFDPEWRARVVSTWGERAEPPLRDGGVYWQSRGPRFETPAEVRLIAERADVVGMTMGSECVTACQLGVSYAAVCLVDNLANGVGSEPLTQAEYQAGHAANLAALQAALQAVVPALAHSPSAEGLR